MMNPILNMKRKIGMGVLWLPAVGLPLTCLELFGNKEISDEDRGLFWAMLIIHAAAAALSCVFFIGFILYALCIVYAVLTFCGKSIPEIPFVWNWGKKLAELTKPADSSDSDAVSDSTPGIINTETEEAEKTEE